MSNFTLLQLGLISPTEFGALVYLETTRDVVLEDAALRRRHSIQTLQSWDIIQNGPEEDSLSVLMNG